MIEKLIGLSHWEIDFFVFYLFIQGAFFSIFPEEVVLPTLGVLWGQGKVGFAESFVASILGLTCGDLILMGMGRFFGLKLLKRRPFSWILDAETIDAVLSKVQAVGPKLIFLVRFVPTTRAPVFFASGMNRMSVWTFIQADWAGMLVWIPLLIWLGHRMGGTGSLDQAFHRLGLLFLVLIATGIGVSIYRDRKKRIRERAKSAMLAE